MSHSMCQTKTNEDEKNNNSWPRVKQMKDTYFEIIFNKHNKAPVV